MADKVILDLCGGTGSWSEPYRAAGYDVRVITLPGSDVRWFEAPRERIHGILAAPPCDHFSGSGAQYWRAKDGDGRTLLGLSIVDACIRIVYACRPDWWALENPVGRLRRWIGAPVMIFDPCDYGDPYTKKTLLWGNFTHPPEASRNTREGLRSGILAHAPRRQEREDQDAAVRDPARFCAGVLRGKSMMKGGEGEKRGATGSVGACRASLPAPGNDVNQTPGTGFSTAAPRGARRQDGSITDER